jgi:excisionase family DNA binding protein
VTEKKLMSVEQVAGYLQVHEQTVRRWIHRGDLAAVKVGRQFRVDPEEVKRFASPTIRKIKAEGPIRKTNTWDRPLLVDGRKLKRARQEAGISIRELSLRARVSESWLYTMQRAPRHGIYSTSMTVKGIADALGVEVEDLLREKPET